MIAKSVSQAATRIACALVVFAGIGIGVGTASAADDFNPPSWVDTDNNGLRDNKDEEFLEAGESMVIGVNPDWDPPANSTSYHWHWWPTQSATYNGEPTYEEYDAYDSGQPYMPDHNMNFWQTDGSTWFELQPPPLPRNWGDYAPPLDDMQWQGKSIPAGMPTATITNGAHGGAAIWSRDDQNQPFTGVFDVPLYAGLHSDPALDTTLVRLQFGGGFGSSGNYTYWDVTVEGLNADGTVDSSVSAVRTFLYDLVSDTGTIYYEDWEIDGTPDRMRVSIDFTGTSVDQVLIDTIAVPEPATLALLSLGGFALLRRRTA